MKLYVAHESTPKISLKNGKKCKEKDKFYSAVNDLLGSAIKGHT